MSKRRRTYSFRSSSKRQKIEEPSNEESEIDDGYFTCGEVNKLPDQILVIIFEFLSPEERICIERVSKRWNKLSKCSWSKFRSFSFKEENFCELLVKHPQVAETLFSRCGKWLKSVSVDESPIRYNLLSIFGTYCPNLENVDFTGAKFSKYKSFLKFFSINCCKLKSVSFNGCFPKVEIDAEFEDFFVNSPHLTSLKLSKTSNLSGRCFANLSLNLKQLDLSQCSRLDDEGVQFVSDRCSHLEVLNFGHCDKITAGCFGYICEKLPELRILYLAHFNASLQEIKLSKALSHLKQISQLHLTCNSWVTDETLGIISRACQSLQILSLSACFEVSDSGLMFICRLQYLSELNLCGLQRVTDVGVTTLAHKLCQLEKLDLSLCLNISDNSVVELAKWCQNLKVLDVRGCEKVTDASVRAFCNYADNRTSVLMLKVYDGSIVSSKYKSKAAKKKLQDAFLSIEFTCLWRN